MNIIHEIKIENNVAYIVNNCDNKLNWKKRLMYLNDINLCESNNQLCFMRKNTIININNGIIRNNKFYLIGNIDNNICDKINL